MKLKMILGLVVCSMSTQVLADKEYWVDSNGDYVRDRNGHCVRTILWTEAAAIPGCEGMEEKAVVKQAAAPIKKAEPKKTMPVEAKAVAPVQTTFNLSSGATFELGGSALSAAGKAEIAALVSKFDGKMIDSVVIEGHTDDSGAASFNQQLSEKRAKAVKDELVANGTKAEKISTVGYGESNPIADNTTREGRAQNRRVEIKVGGVQG